MFRRSTCALWATCTVGLLPAAAENPFRTAGPSPWERKTLALVEKLGAADYREREKAQRDLTALGAPARPFLKQAALATDSPEVERRLTVLIEKLERDDLFNPRRVTFKGNKPLRELFDVIAEQTGYAVGGGPDDDKQRLTVDWKAVSFWEAVDQVCDAAGLQADVTDAGVQVMSRDAFDPHVCRSGPFRVAATNVTAVRSLQLSSLPRRGLPVQAERSLSLNLVLTAEPKNKLLGIGIPQVTKATDDVGTNLAAADANDRASYYPSTDYGGYQKFLNVSLAAAGRDATAVKELKGKVMLTLLAATVPSITVDKLPAVQKKTFVSRTTELFVESVSEPTADGFVVTLTAKHLKPTNEDYAWANSVYQRLEAYDEDGRKFVTAGIGQQDRSPGAVGMTVNFAPAGGQKFGRPAKLVLVEWVTVLREVEFEFRNVPLP